MVYHMTLLPFYTPSRSCTNTLTLCIIHILIAVTFNCFELHQLCGKHISHNKVNIGSSGTHDAWVVYPWFCAPDPVCLLCSSKLRAFTVLPSTNYFFKVGGWGEGVQTDTTRLIIPFYKYSQSNNCPFQQGFH